MDVIDVERPDGVVVTLGGQTPLKLARMLEESGVNIMGTKPDAIDFAEDRERFAALLDKLGIMYPPAGQATSFEVAAHIGYPLLVRPSYVLGGRGMMIAYDAEHLRDYMAEAARISPDYPVYLDRFLEGAIESDVDALCDGEEVYIGGILEHIEEAGIHSGDSATCIPPFSFSESLQAKLREITRRIAMALGVRGLVNVQYAIKGETVYVIEANPRASRTVPFISKATGVPLAKCAARIMAGDSIASLGLPSDERQLDWFCMKEAVMPWGRFPGADVILGPEMKSTGEVMGIAKSYPEAYAKTQLAIDYKLPDPSAGKVFISVCDRDKRHILSVARILRYGARAARRQRDVRSRGEDQRPARRRASQHRRPHRRWQDCGNHQHAVRPGLAWRWLPATYRGRASRCDLRDGDVCRQHLRECHRGRARGPAGSRQRQRHGHGRHRPAGPAAVHGVV